MATPTSLPATFVAGNVLTAAQMNNLRGAFRVLQVVQDTKTDTFTTTSTTYVDVTGLSVTITPSSTSSKILIFAQVTMGGVTAAAVGHMRISGGNATTYVGDAASSRTQDIVGGYIDSDLKAMQLSMIGTYLDSPATTAATTYTVQVRAGTLATQVAVNRSGADGNGANEGRGASSIIVMEISA